jgi:TorA maturation chaperone TorD
MSVEEPSQQPSQQHPEAHEAAAASAASAASVAPLTLALADEDQARADFYALLARLLLAAPDAALLAALRQAEPVLASGEFALEDAWLALTQAASVVDAPAARAEFSALFESIGNPLINPNASVYITGHLNDVPLAELRHELARLRLARAPGAGDFEDHLGALCETMRVLVAGAPGVPRRPLDVQKAFFENHIRPWYAACLADIDGAAPANFYRVVARVADAFLSIEAQAFAVLDALDPVAA